jgi:dienelactone hydrolase
MAQVLLFHHAQGQTSGFLAFADELRRAGHTVHAPDLYNGRTFGSLDEGVAYAGEIGSGEIMELGARAADGLPSELVYAGFSLGVLPAQKLAQTRSGARGALLFHSCVPTSEFESSWLADVPVQVHAMEADPLFVDKGDLNAARALVESAEHAELFLYPGDQHLFADAGLPRTTRTPLHSAGARSSSSATADGALQGAHQRAPAHPRRSSPKSPSGLSCSTLTGRITWARLSTS